MKNTIIFFFIVTSVFSKKVLSQNFFAEGQWIKVSTTTSGIYKITKNDFDSWGLNTSDPKKIKIYGGDGRMLEQQNNKTQYLEPQQVPILLLDTGIYATNFCIFFNADAPKTTIIDQNGILRTRLNIYTDTVYYYITANEKSSNYISIPAIQSSLPTRNPSNLVLLHDQYQKDEVNLFWSGRTWLSDKLNKQNPNFKKKIDLFAPESTLKLSFHLLGSSTKEITYFDVKVNDDLLINSSIGISNSDYGVKLNSSIETLDVDKNLLRDNKMEIDIQYDLQGDAKAYGYINFLEWQYESLLQNLKNKDSFYNLSGERSVCTLDKSKTTVVWTKQTSNSYIQSIALPFNKTDSTCFNLSKDTTRNTLIDVGTITLKPKFEKFIRNFDLTVDKNPELLVIYHPLFKNEVDDFKSHKEKIGMSTQIADVSQIFDHYGSGKKDISAIRNYIKDVYSKNNKLKYILLFGDCSFDYKNRLSDNTNFIPVYQSEESFDNILTYSSDDYFGFLGEDEGLWIESYEGNHTLDVSVGRFPVKSVNEAKIVVKKIKDYEQFSDTKNWKSNILFVADDKDGAEHVNYSNALMDIISEKGSEMFTKNLYLDAFDRSKNSVDDIKKELISNINDGVMIVNFIGHGSEYSWTEEQLLTIQDIKNLKNKANLPLFVTATCQFGRYDYPAIQSGADELFISEVGAIGLVTTTRPVYSSSNFEINSAFYNALLDDDSERKNTLGSIFATTKNNSLNSVYNRNFSLIGDPSLRLKIPKAMVVADSINHIYSGDFTDTLSPAETIAISGHIQSITGKVDSTFNGWVEISIYDSKENAVTKGYNKQEITLYDKNSIQIFNTKAKVINGYFNLSFTLPYDIPSSFGLSQMLFYASSTDTKKDALGNTDQVVIGGDAKEIANLPPTISVEMPKEKLNDFVSTKATMKVFFNDDVGILLNKTSLGKETKMIINKDYSNPIFLLDRMLLENNSSKNVSAIIELKDLAIGSNTIEFSTWDVYGIGSTKIVELNTGFAVDISVFPNPVADKLTIEIKNTILVEDYEVELNIYNGIGKQISQKNISLNQTQLQENLTFTADELNLFEQGIYFYNVKLRYKDSNDVFSLEGKITKL